MLTSRRLCIAVVAALLPPTLAHAALQIQVDPSKQIKPQPMLSKSGPLNSHSTTENPKESLPPTYLASGRRQYQPTHFKVVAPTIVRRFGVLF